MANSENSKYVCNHVKKRKRDLISIFSNKCCLCGFDKFQEALEFHHVNPQEKKFGITDSNAVTKSLEKQIQEVRKCVLLCANCHRGVHAGYLTIPVDDITVYFDEKQAQKLIEENLAIKNGQKFFCNKCGKEISRDATHCVECSRLISRKVDRPSREELKKLIREKPFTHIAKNFCVSDNAVKKWCLSYGLPSKKKEINLISDEDWVKM